MVRVVDYSYSARQSHAGSSAVQSDNANLNTKLREKKKEIDALFALERACEEYHRRMKAMAKDCDTMANAGKVHGEVLAQWPNMFRVLNLYVSGQATSQSDPNEEETEHPQLGERLVRVPIDGLGSGDNDINP